MGQLSLQPGFGECQRELQQVCLEVVQGDLPRLAVPHEMGHGKGAWRCIPLTTGDRSTEDRESQEYQEILL